MNHLSGGTSGAWGISVGYKSNNSSLGGSENAGQGEQVPPVDGAAGEGNFLLRWRKRLVLHYPLVDIMTNQGIKPNDQLRDSKFTGSVG